MILYTILANKIIEKINDLMSYCENGRYANEFFLKM